MEGKNRAEKADLETILHEILKETLEELEKEMAGGKTITDVRRPLHIIDAAIILTDWVPASIVKPLKKTEIFEYLEECAMKIYSRELESECRYLSVACKLIALCESKIDYHTRHMKGRRRHEND